MHTDDIRYLHKMSTYCETLLNILLFRIILQYLKNSSLTKKSTHHYTTLIRPYYFKNVSHWILDTLMLTLT